jgi:hypothetical protein
VKVALLLGNNSGFLGSRLLPLDSVEIFHAVAHACIWRRRRFIGKNSMMSTVTMILSAAPKPRTRWVRHNRRRCTLQHRASAVSTLSPRS